MRECCRSVLDVIHDADNLMVKSNKILFGIVFLSFLCRRKKGDVREAERKHYHFGVSIFFLPFFFFFF